MKFFRGFLMAWGTFCIIPCPSRKWDENARRQMLMVLPLIGLFIGALWGGLFLLLQWAGMHIALKAAFLTVFPFIITGGIHLDGFMDCNDAIFSRKPEEEKQRILKDSNVGAFAVFWTVMMFLVFFAAMWTVIESHGSEAFGVFLLVPAVSRLIAAIFTLVGKPIETSQYSTMGTAKAKRSAAWLGVISILCLAVLFIAGVYLSVKGTPWDTVTYIFDLTPNENVNEETSFLIGYGWFFLSMILCMCGAGIFAKKKIGGMSGDIAGYMIVWGELVAVVVFAMTMI